MGVYIMNELPVMTKVDGGVCWEHTFERFSALCYVPENDKDDGLLNYGFVAPYLLVFAPEKFDYAKAVAFAKEKGFDVLLMDRTKSIEKSKLGYKDKSECIRRLHTTALNIEKNCSPEVDFDAAIEFERSHSKEWDGKTV